MKTLLIALTAGAALTAGFATTASAAPGGYGPDHAPAYGAPHQGGQHYGPSRGPAAQPAWAAVNPQRRARVMFAFKRLVEARMDELAALLSSEHGKTIPDSKGDIQRGLEVVEFACGIPHLLKGEYTEGAGPGIDLYSIRQPLGVVAGITPFNFPAMIPMWKFAPAIACGNAFILKPSERDPSVPVRLAELALEAGLPEGIFNVVHGDKEMVDAILDHPARRLVELLARLVERCPVGAHVNLIFAALVAKIEKCFCQTLAR